MQFLLTFAVALAFGFSLLQCGNPAANNSANTAKINQTGGAANNAVTAPVAEEAPRIALADAKKDFDAGTAIFVDTRAEAAFRQEHVKGAINIPAESFQTRYTEVPKDKKIIAYCS